MLVQIAQPTNTFGSGQMWSRALLDAYVKFEDVLSFGRQKKTDARNTVCIYVRKKSGCVFRSNKKRTKNGFCVNPP